MQVISGSLAGVSSEEIDRCNDVLAGLKEQERKLLRKHYDDEISEELFAEEQARIKRERADTETIVGRLTVDHDRLLETLALTLQLASYDLQDLDLRATPQIRRLMNQAIFEAIWLSDDDVDRSRLAAPLHETRELAGAVAAAENRKAPDLGSEALDGGWIRTEMVGFVGTYSNVEAIARIRRLLPKLEKLAAEGGRRRSPRVLKRRESAPILCAVTQVLEEAAAPMRAVEVHRAVERLRGGPVAWSSVKDCLASNARPGGRFVRIARGRYAVA